VAAEEEVEVRRAEETLANYVAGRVDQVEVWRASVGQVVEKHRGLLPTRVGLDSIDRWVEEELGLESFMKGFKGGAAGKERAEAVYEAIYTAMTDYKDLSKERV
jgi:hypothetical protein